MPSAPHPSYLKLAISGKFPWTNIAESSERLLASSNSEEVSSIEWEFINMSEEEEHLIHRMHKLVGDRWGLIAGRIPGRKAEEIERFWIMTHSQAFSSSREKLSRGINPNPIN